MRRKTRPGIARSTPIIVGSRKEVADGFADDAGAHPSRSIPAGIVQSTSRDANPHVISSVIIIQEKMGNGSAATASGDGRRVGGAGGKGDVGSAASGNSGSHRVDVYGVGARKQGRELEVGIAGLVGVEEVSVIGRSEFPSVSIVANGGAYSDVTGVVCGRRAGENPEGLVGGVVLAGIDVDEKLGLGLFQRNQSKQSCGDYKGAECQTFTACGGGGDCVFMLFQLSLNNNFSNHQTKNTRTNKPIFQQIQPQCNLFFRHAI